MDVSTLQDTDLFTKSFIKNDSILATAVAAIQELKAIADKNSIPVGTVVPYAGQWYPTDNWLFCEGQYVSKNTYPDLWYALTADGTDFPYGPDDDDDPENILFALPNMSRRVPAGWDASYYTDPAFDYLGQIAGESEVTLIESEIPSHGHTFSTTSGGMSANSTLSHSATTVTAYGTVGLHDHDLTGSSLAMAPSGGTAVGTTSVTVGDHTVSHTHSVSGTTDDTGGSGPHNNLQPYIVLYYLIKAK